MNPESAGQASRRNVPAGWTELDTRAVDTARVLVADIVEHARSGHPGAAMSLAPLAYTLFQRVMRHDPGDPAWPGRDRFVLSAGHGGLALYVQLFLAGYGVQDLRRFRSWETPYGHIQEATTGPRGQGLADAVGMARAARRERALFDPGAAPGESPFDHRVYVIASDDDLQEGVTAETAGRQELDNLIVFYADGKISIDGRTTLWEDAGRRYAACGWHVQVVGSGEDVAAIERAIAAAQADPRPSIILLRTVIGYPAPTRSDSAAAHVLRPGELAAVKKLLGFDQGRRFHVDDDVLAHTRSAAGRGKEWHALWQQQADAWSAAHDVLPWGGSEASTTLFREFGLTAAGAGRASLVKTQEGKQS